jgi:glutaredoxin
LYEREELYDFFDHEEDEIFLSKIKSFYNHETIPVVVENDIDTGGTKFIGGFDDLKEHLEERK